MMRLNVQDDCQKKIMNYLLHAGRMLLFIGLGFVILGGLFIVLSRVKWIGHLPGDILIQKKNLTFYFPVTTSILLSIVLSFLWWIFSKK